MYRILLFCTAIILLVSCKVKINEKDDAGEDDGLDAIVLDLEYEIIKDTSITKVVMLGSGNPNADPERSGPCVAIVVNETPYIFDCGPGLVRRASAANKKGVIGLEMSKLSKLFITHLHSDHTIGYPDIIHGQGYHILYYI